MEIKVNEEIRNIKETFLLGLSLRQTIWSLIALLSGVGIYFLVRDSMQLEFAVSLSMLAATPSACLGFIVVQGMPAEKVFIEFITSYIVNPMELYNSPKNQFAEWKREDEYNAPEAVKARNAKKIRNTAIFVSLSIFFMTACVVVYHIGGISAFNQQKEDSYTNLISQYQISLYSSEQAEQLNVLIDEFEASIKNAKSESELNTLLRTYKNKFNAIPDYPSIKADEFDKTYSPTLETYPQLSVVLSSLKADIKSAVSLDETDQLYDDAVLTMKTEIESQSQNNKAK